MKKPIPFGKYYLLERINVGGMAEVFRAKAYGVEGFERLVAVKRILPNIAEDKEFIRMFVDEAKIAVQLNHANIAQIFDLGVVEKDYYIALEHIHGRDLRAIFDRCRQKSEPMPIAQACFVTMKVCEGLDYAHNKRDQAGRELFLVHRDVSPQNILVSFEGEVKVIDFGIAKAAGKGSKTQAGILKGKFGYMSPEQVRGLPIDRRSDVFSCGIVLYELLTGERLFFGESDFSTLEKVRNVEILPPSTYNRKIPDELERIVLKALAKDVEDRYHNAIDLHDELQAFVYTAGEFYSRKDLAGWMKTMFSREIEEETAKLESYRSIAAPPEAVAAKPRRPEPPPRRVTAALGTVAPPPLPGALKRSGPQAVVAKSSGHTEQLEWDEDELETSIYEEEEKAKAAAQARLGVDPGLALAAPPGEPDLAALVTTAKGWSAGVDGLPLRAAAPLPRLGALADGSNEKPSPFAADGPTLDERTREDDGPSAVVALANLARSPQRADAPILDSPTIESTFGGQVVARPRRKLSVGTWIGIGATTVTAIFIIVLVIMVAGGEGPSAAGETPTAPAGAGVAATEHPAPPAGAVNSDPTAGTMAATPDPDTGFDLIVDPAKVAVQLDGRSIGEAPLQIRNLAEGEHTIEIAAPLGFFSKQEVVRVTKGKAERVVISLQAMEIVGHFTSDPAGAKVTLTADGQRIALDRTPIDYKLDPRHQYEVTFKKEGFAPETQPIVMTGDAIVPVAVSLTKLGGGAAVALDDHGHGASPGGHGAATSHDGGHGDRPDPGDGGKAAGDGGKAAGDGGKAAGDGGKAAGDGGKVAAGGDDSGAAGAADAGGEGTLVLGSKPPCRIFIDGRDTGMKTPQTSITLKAGKHKVTLVNNEFGIKESFQVKVEAGKSTKEIKDLMDRVQGQ